MGELIEQLLEKTRRGPVEVGRRLVGGREMGALGWEGIVCGLGRREGGGLGG